MAKKPLSFSYSKLTKNVYRNFQKASGNQFRLMLREWLDDYGNMLLNEIIETTPVVTGKLKESWERGKIEGTAPKYKITIRNTARNKAVDRNGNSIMNGYFDNYYAQFVEYGHRGRAVYLDFTGNGHGVIIVNTDDEFTHGKFFVKSAGDKISKIARKNYNFRTRLFFRSLGFNSVKDLESGISQMGKSRQMLKMAKDKAK